MNGCYAGSVHPIMKSIAALACSILLASCAGDPGHFDGGRATRSSRGNAALEGPSAGDVIRDVHYDRARQNYEDRRDRRRY